MKKRRILITAIVALLIVVFYKITGKDGEVLFNREGCINCHTFKGRGGVVGPDLTGVFERRGREWIRVQIINPRIHNPKTIMPSFSHLSKKEVTALIKYLKKGR